MKRRLLTILVALVVASSWYCGNDQYRQEYQMDQAELESAEELRQLEECMTDTECEDAWESWQERNA